MDNFLSEFLEREYMQFYNNGKRDVLAAISAAIAKVKELQIEGDKFELIEHLINEITEDAKV